MAINFAQWLGGLSDAMNLAGAADFLGDRTLVVNEVVCTFVHPCGEREDLAAVLVDAGMTSTGVGHEAAQLALSRNLENFVTGAPLFFVNPSSRHLVLGQSFEFRSFDAASFADTIGSLALQAKAWQHACGGAR